MSTTPVQHLPNQMTGTSSPFPVRDVHLQAEFESVPKYFAADDPVLSHMFAMLSATFPDGENYFVRSVEAIQDQIDDPKLASEVESFIGQEAMHGREHRAFNAHLQTLGYHTKLVEDLTESGYRFTEKLKAPRYHLAMTAAVEHYTATLAEMLLSDPQTRACFTHEAARRLFVWHSLEESEHKAVAFDAYKHVGGGELLRRFVMTIAHIDFLSNLVGMTTLSLLSDPTVRRHPLWTLRSILALRRSPFASWGAAKQLLGYYREGFHPNQRDTAALITEWRHRLFSETVR